MFLARSIRFGVACVMLAAAVCVAQASQTPYVWKNVIIRGGGFVSGIEFSPAQRGLVYARTDVGGAYRSDDAGNHWVPITDMLDREQGSYQGIESLAVDPEDANKVYLAGGMYSEDWGGPAGILRSDNQGKSWALTPLPLKMGGNDDGRNCGEKLAVDPNLGSVLYFGSRKNGLWRSTDGAVTWAKVQSFPVKDKVAAPWTQVGITFVALDKSKGTKGAATQSIYVGVADASASLYRSSDAGKTWQAVAGPPKGMFPSHAKVSPSGDLYMTFIDNIGPNGITNGVVMKLTAVDGKWEDISPVHIGASERKYGFGGIGMDAEHPETLMVTTLDKWWPTDEIYRTTDGGKHWKLINSQNGGDAVFSASQVPWVYWHKDKTGGTGWMNDIEIDPFNPDKVMYTTGEGIWGTADMTDADRGKPTRWGFPDDGLEETVPIALVSPPEGAHLLSGVGDIGGFRHDDLTKSPAGGFFFEPQFTNTDSIDFAAANPLLVVRVGRGGDKGVHGAYSTDGGTRWKAFGSEPPTSRYGSGRVAISADGKVVVWTPDKGNPHWSDNFGGSWKACDGLAAEMHVVSDRVNPNKFYSFAKGTVYVSTDKARSFKLGGSVAGDWAKRAELAPVAGIEGDLWVVAADGLYHSRDSGAKFSQVKSLEKAYHVGFGKAPEGKSYPAIYLNGRVGTVDAPYRSDDGGSSWVRLNDDAHQYGWTSMITGDPRVYGRVYLGTGGRGIIYGDPQQSVAGTR